VAGWAFQWLAQLSFTPDSWTAPQDQVRAGAGDDATRKAAGQILAHAARLRAAGETRIPLYVLDAGYDEAPLTWDLREHLSQVQILVRLRNDRVLYRDPPPVPHKAGRPRKHGNGTDRFECKNPATWGQPGHELTVDDPRYGQVSVMSWSGLHPKLFCRGRFGGFARPPVIKCHLIRVTVQHLPNRRAVPGPLWLWWVGPGAPGPSKSLTLAQAEALLAAAENTSLHAYIVVSLLIGARTEELRPLTWSHVDLDSDPPFIMVWRSVRAGGDTKTRKSRRTLKLPQRRVDVLRDHQARQEEISQASGSRWQDNDLVFPSRAGTPADASHVRRSFRTVVAAAGLDSHEWTPRELRHSFVSLLSDADVPIEQISRLVGHSSSTTTETVYRKQIR